MSDLGELAELRAATARLSDQVAGLRETLQTVNALREQQMQQEARLLRTEGEVHDQAALTDHMVGHLEDIDATASARAEAVRRWRLVIIGLAVVVLTLTMLFLVYNHGRTEDLRRACGQRNAADQLVQEFLDDSIRGAGSKPLTPNQQHELDLLRRAFPVVNCSLIH